MPFVTDPSVTQPYSEQHPKEIHFGIEPCASTAQSTSKNFDTSQSILCMMPPVMLAHNYRSLNITAHLS